MNSGSSVRAAAYWLALILLLGSGTAQAAQIQVQILGKGGVPLDTGLEVWLYDLDLDLPLNPDYTGFRADGIVGFFGLKAGNYTVILKGAPFIEDQVYGAGPCVSVDDSRVCRNRLEGTPIRVDAQDHRLVSIEIDVPGRLQLAHELDRHEERYIGLEAFDAETLEPAGLWDFGDEVVRALPPGRYFVVASAYGIFDQIFPNVFCDRADSDLPCRNLTQGDAIEIRDNEAFEWSIPLTPTPNLRVRFVGESRHYAGLALSRVDGRESFGLPGFHGIYDARLPQGNFYVHSSSSQVRNQVWGGSTCQGRSCSAGELASGWILRVEPGAVMPEIEFDLDPWGDLRGVVVDRETQIPLPRGIVQAIGVDPDGLTAQADVGSSGEFVFHHLAPGRYVLTASRGDNYTVIWPDIPCVENCSNLADGSVVVKPAGPVYGIRFELDRRRSISGQVVDARSGEPVPRGGINLLSETGQYLEDVTSDDEGRFAFSVYPGRYRLVHHRLGPYPSLVLGGGFCSGAGGSGCRSEGGTLVEVLRNQDVEIDFPLFRGATIRGQASTKSGDAVSASVLTSDLATIAGSYHGDREGPEFSIEGLSPGRYYVSASAEDHVRGIWQGVQCPQHPCDFTSATPVDLELEQVADGVSIEVQPLSRIRGKLIEAVSGEAFDASSGRGTVWAVDEFGEYRYWTQDEDHGDDGMFELKLPAGTWYLVFTSLDHLRQTYGAGDCYEILRCRPELVGTPITIEPGETRSGVDFELRRGASISGRIVSETTNLPLGSNQSYLRSRYSNVRAQNLDGGSRRSTTVERDGTFALDGLPPGRWVLHAFVPRHISETYADVYCGDTLLEVNCPITEAETIELGEADHIQDVEIRLVEGGTISTTARDSTTGKPIHLLEHLLFDRSGEKVTRNLTSGLPDGAYFLVSGAREYRSELFPDIPCPNFECDVTLGQPIEIIGSESVQEIEFDLTPSAQCPGTQGSMCLGEDSRFEVSARWTDFEGRSEDAGELQLTQDSGYFWFFGEDNVEVVVKVLDACAISNRFWVFAAGLTNVGVELSVIDDWSNHRKTYINPLGASFDPILDVDAFSTCGEPPPASSQDIEIAEVPRGPFDTSQCTDDPNILCLGNRFEMRATFATDEGADVAKPVQLTADSGYFWFFGEENVEVVAKVLDACIAPFDRFWVFAAGLTNVEVEIEVTDVWTGAVQRYENQGGAAFQPVLDTDAFATCDASPPGT